MFARIKALFSKKPASRKLSELTPLELNDITEQICADIRQSGERMRAQIRRDFSQLHQGLEMPFKHLSSQDRADLAAQQTKQNIRNRMYGN